MADDVYRRERARVVDGWTTDATARNREPRTGDDDESQPDDGARGKSETNYGMT